MSSNFKLFINNESILIPLTFMKNPKTKDKSFTGTLNKNSKVKNNIVSMGILGDVFKNNFRSFKVNLLYCSYRLLGSAHTHK